MSRVGKSSIDLGKVKISNNNNILLLDNGSEKREFEIPSEFEVKVEDSKVFVSPKDFVNLRKKLKAKKLADIKKSWGLNVRLLKNAINGLNSGFSENLEIKGTGYRASIVGAKLLNIFLGYSHNIIVKIPNNVDLKVVSPTIINISSTNKEDLGRFKDLLLSLRRIEPYKGKGVRIQGQNITLKVTKGK